jgi:hypothetical protein
LGILSIGALGLGVLAAVVLRILVVYGEAALDSDSLLVLVIPMLGITLFFMFLALVVYSVGTIIYLMIRFYKNKFTDEGYLTFTLPVNSRQIFLSSAVYILIWQILSGLVVSLAVGIALLFGTAQDGMINWEIFESLDFAVSGFDWIFGVEAYEGYLFMSILKSVAAWMATTVIMMTCVTVGAVAAKRHKLLASIGIYYGVNIVINGITGVVSFLVMLMSVASETYYKSVLTGGAVVEVLLQIGLMLGGYFLSTYLMKNKLNLP